MDNAKVSVSKRDKNIMTIPERIGEFVGIFFILLITAFFAYHLSRNTGFMTSDFGMTGAIFLFGSAALSIVSSGARAVIGKRDKARPFELVSAIYSAIASFWFLTVFPFNFAHLADPLPSYLRFILSWISNSIGWVILLLAVIGSIAAAINAAVRLVLDIIRGAFR